MKLLTNILTEDQEIYDICEKYWHWDYQNENFVGTVKSIGKEYNLNSVREVLETVQNNSQAYTTDLKCSICSREYQFKSRSDYMTTRTKTEWICEQCQADIYAKNEKKKNEDEALRRKLLKELREKQKLLIEKNFELVERKTVDINELTLRDAIYLLTVVRAAILENFQLVFPIDTVESKIAPNESMKYDILRHLYKSNLIFVHPKSEPEAFNFENDEIKTINLGKVTWLLPYSIRLDTEQALVEDIKNTFREMAWKPEWHEEQLGLWYEIGLHETLEYLHLCLNEHKLPYQVGEKTIHVINQGLKDFSIGQLYSFIWRATRDAAAFKIRNNTTSKHAANTVVGSIQRASEKALAEGWEIKPYRRDFRCPQSILSEVYFNTVIQVGDEGFSRKPFAI